MKKNIYYIILMVALYMQTACTDRFESINTNPNSPTTTSVILLLNPQMRSIIQAQFQYDTGATLAHQVAKTNYNDVAQYNFGTSEDLWNSFYYSLANLEEMISVAQQNDQPSSEAIGYILKAFCASQLTDHWGNVPYTEASMGDINIHPKYDDQRDIYTAENGIISLLEKADNLLSNSHDLLPDDIGFGGDRTKWRKLANSLRLRFLIRISNRKDESIPDFNWQSQMQDCLSKPLMENNSDNLVLPYLESTPNRCPVFELRSGEFDYLRMSQEIANQLNATADPRMTVWFQPTATSLNQGNLIYKGIPNGCSSTTLNKLGYNQSDVSMLGHIYRDTPNGAVAVLMNAAEVKFLQAEAVQRNWTNGNASLLYQEGIRLSMEQYGIGANAINSYLTQPSVAFNSEEGIEQIMTQKWLANFMVGYEGWFDFLRTGLPKQTLPLDNRNPTATGEIPSRFYYPETEQAVNKEQYDAAIQKQGGKDDINTKLWWE